jgi:hypothetical protein
MTQILATELIRLQCYEGLDASQAFMNGIINDNYCI